MSVRLFWTLLSHLGDTPAAAEDHHNHGRKHSMFYSSPFQIESPTSLGIQCSIQSIISLSNAQLLKQMFSLGPERAHLPRRPTVGAIQSFMCMRGCVKIGTNTLATRGGKGYVAPPCHVTRLIGSLLKLVRRPLPVVCHSLVS